VVGNRYRIRALLGHGGMGDVWRAQDLKLRVDVALKTLRPALLARPRALETLRREVRAARQVVSPNVCRVFDLVELEGRELVSMEHVDGTTLRETLATRSPLEGDEAREIAAQLLAGLEAIHGAGLVHRDIKPENVMLTRAGRLVVMDFGLAKALASEATGMVAGTAAYMSPEQASGEALDARADVFAAGVVLAELMAPSGVRDRTARDALLAGIHRSPPQLAETPWARVLRKAVAPLREDRFPSAAALARALEEVTLRVAGAERLVPYPGLASFGAGDAEYFFGRELEIEALWRKLRRPHLLALVAPSGAGKSSFLRAGLAAAAPPGWRAIVTSPGDRPFKALAQALLPELAGDPHGLELLLRIDEAEAAVAAFGRWRFRHDHALVVIDQFEELFTQNPPEVQAVFADIVGRLALESDVHVLLAMRDDFLFQCHAHEALRPILSELTLLGPLTGPSLRRALVQPALKCGYRFEDEALVDAMLGEVENERGALPLLAFAAAQLWARRDRERGLLTREAYAAIGGVGGALAQHAEATLERIGTERVAVVRELLRNLVTAQGTRATVDREELLSVFTGVNGDAGWEAAAAVLDVLVDARLLTSYELPKAEGESAGRRRVEIIHESLLSQWPRLVRWLAQDQEGALLRDQLRQAARLWDERGRPEDLLWTGTSYREYELWRERYAGQLSAAEETFARAMSDRARRRQRQRRVAVATVVGAALAVASGLGVLWRRSEAAHAEAVAAARTAEAQQLFALGQLELEKHPTGAVAYALASLEHADSRHARLLALRALWRGPVAFALEATDKQGPGPVLAFSPDGRWLANVEQNSGTVRLWSHDGSGPRVIESPGVRPQLGFSADSRHLVVLQAETARIYSLPAAGLVRQIDEASTWGFVAGQDLVTAHPVDPLPDGRVGRLFKLRRLPDGEPERLGVWTYGPKEFFWVDPIHELVFTERAGDLYEQPLRAGPAAAPRRALRIDERLQDLKHLVLSPDGDRIHTWGASGAGKIWSRATGARVPGPRMDRPGDASWSTVGAAASRDGRWLAFATGEEGTVLLWDLPGPVAAEPQVLGRDARVVSAAFAPSSSWLAVRDSRALTLWPLAGRHPHVLRAPTKGLWAVAVDPRGRWVAGAGQSTRNAWLWPLAPEAGADRATLQTGTPTGRLRPSPSGDRLVAGGREAFLVPLDGGPPKRLPGFENGVIGVDFDREGRRLAVGGVGFPNPKERVIRLFDLETGSSQVIDPGDAQPIVSVAFWPDGRLLSAGGGSVRLWDVATARSTLLLEGVPVARKSPDGRLILGIRAPIGPGGAVGRALVYDVARKEERPLDTHGDQVVSVAWHPSGHLVVTGSRDGIVRVGPVTGEEPHLLLGHEAGVRDVEAGPDGTWVASASEDGTVRLWPLPAEGAPFHTLPIGELLARLRSLTNFRVVRDPAAAGGYRLGFEPFTGWNRPPPSW
jgi:WD40 repeat protein